MKNAAVKHIAISSLEQQTIHKLLRTYLPGTQVWAYGSRVIGTSTPKSDLDMVAFTSPGQKLAVFELKQAFEESDLPFRVDLFVWDEIPDTFHDRIKEGHVVLQKM